MQLYNLKDDTQVVSFATAVKTGLGRNQGLFFPKQFPKLDNIDELLSMSTWERNFHILRPFVTEDIDDDALRTIIEKTYAFRA